MIVIFGATGKVGGAAASELRRRGLDVRAVMRDAASGGALARLGCDIVAADLHDGRSVERAMRGADGVLVLCPLRPPAEDPEAEALNIIEGIGGALDAVRPRAVVAISDYGAHHPAGTGVTLIFHRLEERLRAIPISTTFLRSAEHMQNWWRQVPSARERGVLPSLHHPVTKPFPTVSAPDVGIIAAEILAAGEEHGRAPRVIHVEGPRRCTATDVAEAVEQLVGRPVTAKALARDRWVPALVSGGIGERYTQLVAELQDAHNAGRIDVEAGVGEVRHGRTELLEALTRGA